MFTFEATKTTPFASPELEGEYKLTIKGRHIKMTKVDDVINIQEKKKDADKIKVGDKVKVVASTYRYPNYVEWVVKEDLTGMTGVVVAIFPHQYGGDLIYTQFEIGGMKRCYLFDLNGLKKI